MNGDAAKQQLLVLVGPTAVGKTKLSLEIAKRIPCEIISGDSMQVYRGMDIGTAKASAEERRQVPHHLIDILDPREPFSVADFQKLAEAAIADIGKRGKLPFVVGGTGLYIQSLCYGYHFSEAGADEGFREEQRRYLAVHGEQALHDRLRAVDPESAERLHPRDTRRVIRALEIHHLTGKPLSAHLREQKRDSPYRLCLIGLTMERGQLYRRIEERVDAMIRDGLVDEVRRLLELGCTREHVSMQGLGYKEIAAYLEGECSLDEAIERLKRDTRRFAKRQLSWFRHMRDLNWVDVTDTQNFSAHLREINDIIAGKLGLFHE